jgi:Ca2+/Na+ antiporter
MIIYWMKLPVSAPVKTRGVTIVVEILIPISMFVALTIILCLFFMFRYKTRSEMQATIRTALDKGQELSPEIIDRLGTPKPPKDKDLRIALIWFALAISTAALGFGIPDDDPEVLQIMLGISAFPFSLGVAYLIMWFQSRRSP